jgi:hypothetical protein
MEPFSQHQGPGRQRGAGHDVGRTHRGLEVGRDRSVEIAYAQTIDQRLRRRRRRVPYADVADGAYLAVGLRQQASDAAGADDKQSIGVRPREIRGGKRRHGGGAPRRNDVAVEQRNRRPMLGIEQAIERVEALESLFMVAGKDVDDLHAQRIVRLPCRHQQQRRIWLRFEVDPMVMAGRRYASTDEHFTQRRYQRGEGQRTLGLAGIDNSHL